jgi:hypothetical protein
MYNIILAIALISALSGIILLLSRNKRRVINSTAEILDGENPDLEMKSYRLHLSVPIWVSGLKIKRETVKNLTERSLRRLRVFILRVDNRLADSLGKLKEDKPSLTNGNERVAALIMANTNSDNYSESPETNTSLPNIWSQEQNYLAVLSNNFNSETFSQLTDLYLGIGDYSTLREQFLRAINNDLSWEDIIKDPKLINSLQIIRDNGSGKKIKVTNRKNSLSPKIHQRKKRVKIN